MMFIDIKKDLGQFTLKIETKIEEGFVIALMGESGSGKSTLLRVLAGLEESKGTIKFQDSVWLDDLKSLPVQKRDIGFVFQDFALFENMSIKEHLSFVSRDKKLANELLKEFKLEEIADLYPRELSGGQKQRVAICRALVSKPKLLLMDEPFSALDRKLRFDIQNFLKEFLVKNSITTVMVTHDKVDLFRLADRVIEIKDGSIVLDKLKSELVERDSKISAEVLGVEGEFVELLAGGKIFSIKREKIDKKVLKVGDLIELSFDI